MPVGGLLLSELLLRVGQLPLYGTQLSMQAGTLLCIVIMLLTAQPLLSVTLCFQSITCCCVICGLMQKSLVILVQQLVLGLKHSSSLAALACFILSSTSLVVQLVKTPVQTRDELLNKYRKAT